MDKQITMGALGIAALCFLAGLTAGCLCSLWGGEAADAAVLEYLVGLTSGTVQSPSIGAAFLGQFQYPVLCFLFGLTVLGVFLIPITLMTRAFFLAFTITSCVRVFGAWNGFLLSVSMLGLPALLALPCLMVLATFGGVSSYARLMNIISKRRNPVSSPALSKEALTRLGICILAMTVAALLEIYVCPILVNAAIPLITGG